MNEVRGDKLSTLLILPSKGKESKTEETWEGNHGMRMPLAGWQYLQVMHPRRHMSSWQGHAYEPLHARAWAKQDENTEETGQQCCQIQIRIHISWCVRKALCVSLFNLQTLCMCMYILYPVIDKFDLLHWTQCLTCNSFNQVLSVHYRIDFNDCVACTFFLLPLWCHRDSGDDGPRCACTACCCCLFPVL